MKPRVYLDVCCLGRPFDDPTTHRIRAESDAVRRIMDWIIAGRLEWTSSEVVEQEGLENPDEQERDNVMAMVRRADRHLKLDRDAIVAAQRFRRFGVHEVDALHLAMAVTGQCDLLLTTDDPFIAAARRIAPPMVLRVMNPVKWATEVGW